MLAAICQFFDSPSKLRRAYSCHFNLEVLHPYFASSFKISKHLIFNFFAVFYHLIHHKYSGISIKRTQLVQKKCVRFIEMSALQKLFLRQFDRKAEQSVPHYTVRLIEMSALQCVRFIEIPLYRVFNTSNCSSGNFLLDF